MFSILNMCRVVWGCVKRLNSSSSPQVNVQFCSAYNRHHQQLIFLVPLHKWQYGKIRELELTWTLMLSTPAISNIGSYPEVWYGKQTASVWACESMYEGLCVNVGTCAKECLHVGICLKECVCACGYMYEAICVNVGACLLGVGTLNS